MSPRPIGIALFAAAALLTASASAHETDQFSVPVGQELVDLGDAWNRLLHEAVRRSVDETNEKITAALTIRSADQRRRRLETLQSPDHLAHKVRWQFPVGLLLIEEIETILRREQKRLQHDAQLVMFRPTGDRATYNRIPLLPDPRVLTRTVVARSSTIKVHGTYMGTDKFGHFLGWGHLYYLQYRLSRGMGISQEDALKAAIATGNSNPVGEVGLHGLLTTGVYSNADLAANLVGAKFYINLTEPVRLQGELCPPMLERDGDFWRLAPHVQPEGRFYSLFVSDHFDEALNPCVYEPVMRGPVRSFVRDHAAELVDWYAGNDPEKRTPQWFDRQWRALTTYYGEDYGHWGDESNLVLLSDLCFNAPPRTKSTAAKPARHRPAGKGYLAKAAPRRAAPPLAPVVVPYGGERFSEGGQSGPVIVADSDQNAAE
jgi:hypothetical protein